MDRVGVARPVLRPPGDHAQDELLEVRRHVRSACARLHGDALQGLREQLDGDLRVEGQRAGHHLVGDDAERVEIAEGGRRLSVDVLRSDVPRRAEALLGERDRRRVDDLRDAEVRQLGEVGSPAGHEEDVLGLEVAVDHPELVRATEGRRDLQGDSERALQIESTGGERRLQGLALDVLHHEEDQPAVFAEVGDLDDVRVVDAVDRARLAQEALAVRHVQAQVLAQDLDRAHALDHHVPGKVDDRHPAAAQPPHQPVARRERASDERVRIARESSAVEGTEPRVVGVWLGAARAELHLSTRSAASDFSPRTRR